MSDVPVADLLMDFLRCDPSGAEMYMFVEEAEDAIVLALDAIFALPDPGPAVDALIRLSCALEIELRSPTAATTIRALMVLDVRVEALIARRESTTERAKNWSAACEQVKNAPKFGAEAPQGTLKAGSLAKAHESRLPAIVRRAV